VSDTAPGNPEYTQWVEPECNAGTLAANFTTTATTLASCMLWRAEFRIPPGHAGFTGIALLDSGAFILPYQGTGQAWLIGDDDLLEYPYGKVVGSNVQLATYNTGIYNHKWEVRLIYTPYAVLDVDQAVIVTPDVADWLAEVESAL
jgi:hypothetical protein